MAETLTRAHSRAITVAATLIAAALAARLWLRHENQFIAAATVALPIAAVAAAALWTGRPVPQLASAISLLACALAGPILLAVPLIALPTLAALRRISPSMPAEAHVAGASWLGIATALLLRQAAPGLAYGAALALAPGNDWRLIAAVAPLMLRGN